jgi:hypothetical protein
MVQMRLRWGRQLIMPRFSCCGIEKGGCTE